MSPKLYDLTAKSIDGHEIALSQYRGSVLLIVNVASRCVLTAQYEQLQSIYDGFKDRGFYVLGFPCNQFGAQEPKSDSEIQSFCSLTYQVTFPMFAKVEVNGPNSHPLFAYLKSQARGFLGSESIKWNFTKFLIDRRGNVYDRYGPGTSPKYLIKRIERLLQQEA